MKCHGEKTFKTQIIYDKARDITEQITERSDDLRSRGFHSQSVEIDHNFIINRGQVSCTCEHKFDRAFCDGGSK